MVFQIVVSVLLILFVAAPVFGTAVSSLKYRRQIASMTPNGIQPPASLYLVPWFAASSMIVAAILIWSHWLLALILFLWPMALVAFLDFAKLITVIPVRPGSSDSK